MLSSWVGSKPSSSTVVNKIISLINNYYDSGTSPSKANQSKNTPSPPPKQKWNPTMPIVGFNKSIIVDFLDRLNFDHAAPMAPSSHITELANEYFASLYPPLPPYVLDFALKRTPLGAAGGANYYPYASTELHLLCCKATTWLFLVDDLGHDFPNELLGFQGRFVTNSPQPNEILTHYAHFLKDFNKLDFVGPFGATQMVRSSLDFCTASALETICGSEPKIPLSATSFPRAFRLKSGDSEKFVQFLFPNNLVPEDKFLHKYIFAIPDLVDLMDFGNDIMSFYKESVVGDERFNFFCNHAATHNMTPVEALGLFCERFVETYQRVRRTMEEVDETGLLKKIVDAYVQGYLRWHLAQPRYRLDEVMN